MVLEFPDLQGIAGRQYAMHDGEDLDVAAAIESHYYPRFAGIHSRIRRRPLPWHWQIDSIRWLVFSG